MRRNKAQRRVIFRHGLSIIEATLSTVIVGLMLLAALRAVGAARMGENQQIHRQQGLNLAQQLMNEILRQHYDDPQYGSGSIGLDGDESGIGDRSLYDDVDDYDGWSASPPQQRDGTILDGMENWAREVEVDWVQPEDLETVAGSDLGIKRIVVRTLYDGAEITEVQALRSKAWRGMQISEGGSEAGGSSGENNPPVAIIMVSPLTGPENLTVHFDASFSQDIDGDSLNFHWNFGDGYYSSSQTVSHTYYYDGSFTASLTVSDGNGGTDTDTVTIQVWDD
jgi:type II secretory pathway pseudopilin PulG